VAKDPGRPPIPTSGLASPHRLPESPSPEKPAEAPPAPAADPSQQLAAALARIAELEAKLAARPTTPTVVLTAPETAGLTPRKYRVRLPGHKSRIVDAEGRARYVDFMEIDATSPGDARSKFEAWNGIRGTEQTYDIQPVADASVPRPATA
jgi:hypothetical protein